MKAIWVLGYQDEVWWSRVSQLNLQSWSEKDEPLRLQELSKNKDDPDPKAITNFSHFHVFLFQEPREVLDI